MVFDTVADGGIRMSRTGVVRDGIFTELAGESAALGGQEGVCLAYKTIFGEEAMFGFAAVCPEQGEDCAGAKRHFCPQSQ